MQNEPYLLDTTCLGVVHIAGSIVVTLLSSPHAAFSKFLSVILIIN